MNEIIKEIESEYKRKKPLPEIKAGDLVQVDVRVIEGESERIQPFVGTVIAVKGGGLSSTFTVRKMSFGVGVERIFPFNSPRIDGIKILKSFKVRRSKLYYLRNLFGKSARLEAKKEGKLEVPSVGEKETVVEPVVEAIEEKEKKNESAKK